MSTSTGEVLSRKTGSVTLVIENFNDFQDLGKYENLRINEYIIWIGLNQRIFVHDDNYTSIYMLNRSDQKAVNFHLKISILTKGIKVYSKEFEGAFDEQNGCMPFTLMRHSLITSKNGYLDKDKLTIFCEIELFDQLHRNDKMITLSQQKELNTLSSDFQSLLNDGKFHDATLVVGPSSKEMHVHKTILAARSPVFAAMFERDYDDKRLGKVHIMVITITDIDSDVCEEMVRYIYTGKVQSLDRYAMNLLVAADKYQLNSLKNICMQYLGLYLTIENAAKVLMLADLHHADELKANCIEYISHNADKVEATDGWKALNSSKPQLGGELFMYLAKKLKR